MSLNKPHTISILLIKGLIDMEEFKVYKVTKTGIVYEVSNYGNVKRNGIIQDIHLTRHGYACAKGVNWIHRAVAELFIPKPDAENKYEVNHIDCNRLNNHVSNLEWLTHKDNCNTVLTRKNISNSHKNRWKKLRNTNYTQKHYRFLDVVIDGVTYKTTDEAMEALNHCRKWVIKHATSYRRGSM